MTVSLNASAKPDFARASAIRAGGSTALNREIAKLQTLIDTMRTEMKTTAFEQNVVDLPNMLRRAN